MARLPFSATRLEGHDINLRSDRLPVKFQHDIREIDDHMDDIVYNAIDIIQERSRDNELRIFYYNLMTDRDYKNRDFEDLIGMIADIVDIGVSEGKFRDVRDAIVPVCEDVVTLHIAYMTEEYPELMDFTERGQERDLDRAIGLFQKYRKAVDVYRRNGNQLPSGRDRYRDDDRGGRDRGRGGSRANLGDDRDDRGGRAGNARRDRWERGAVRGGVHGSPRRQVRSSENRFGNSDQSDRFDDETKSDRKPRVDDPRDGVRDRDDRETRANDDRFDDAIQGSTSVRRVERDDNKPTHRARVQRLPGSSRDNDIEDALEREKETSKQGSNMSDDISVRNQLSDTNNPTLIAFENRDAWFPSQANPHPLVFNHTQDLFYEMDAKNLVVIPRVVNKGTIVNYYDHASMAFGDTPKDFSRFENGDVAGRLNALHDALINPKEDFNIDGTDQTVTYHSKLDFTEHHFLSYGLKDVMLRLNYRRFFAERAQPNGDAYHRIEIAVGKSSIIEPFITTPEEASYLEELRQVSTFTKMAEKLRQLSKKLRPELFLQLDAHLTRAVNRMLRQNLSIPALRINSFTESWLQLFALVTEQYGEGYRDAINTYQEREIRKLFNYDSEAELYVMTQLPESKGHAGIAPFVAAMPTKIMYINEVGFNLDIDMVPDVASQILPEANPFFHDLATELLTKDAEQYGRFYIQTADLRVIEASRSFLNEKAVLLRMIK
jgi:hypothetical protein